MKFNKQASIKTRIESHPDFTTNYEGGVAFKTDPKTELTLRFLTYLVGEPKFYTPKAEDEMETIRQLIRIVAEIDPEYLMKLANYARNEMYLRSAPMFMVVESLQYESVKPFVRAYLPSIISRADEITEILAYFISKNGDIGNGKGTLPNSLKKGIADSFHNFDAYQFAKYNRKGLVTLKDAIRLTHPKPENEEESLMFKQILDDTLPTPETWEVVISNNGSTKEAWDSVIPKMGYMAKLRNLRNFLKVGADLGPVISHLTNGNAVSESKQFPFRFFSAYKVLENTNEGDPFTKQNLMGAIEQALELSVKNIPKLSGNTFITCDESGSMTSPLNARSSVRYIDIANVMGALAKHISENGLASVFGTGFLPVPMTNETVLGFMNKLVTEGRKVGMSTNAYLAIKWLNDNNVNCDRIMIFSDMQCYDSWHGGDSLMSEFLKYRSNTNPNVKLYSFDLTGYGTVQFPQDTKNVVLISGWSDRILEFVRKYEEFGTGLIHDIENHSL